MLHAALTTGSFRITGHGIPAHVLDHLDQSTRDFFASSEKYHYENFTAFEREAASMAVRPEEAASLARDLRESYAVTMPLDPTTERDLPPSLHAAIVSYAEYMEVLDYILHEILTRALTVYKQVSLPRDCLERFRGGTGGRLRCNWYPQVSWCQYEATEAKLHAHADLGVMTILHAPTPGLEELRHGKWTPVPPTSNGELQVMLGHLAHIWSNGAFEPNIHRVVGDPLVERTSYSYFCVGGAVKTAVGPIVGPNEEPRFGRIVGRDYVASILSTLVEGKGNDI